MNAADGDEEDDEGQNHRQTGRKHGNTVFLLHFHHLLTIHFFVVGILLLQFFQLFLVLLHLDVLLSHRHPLIDVEGQNDDFENEGKHDDADADDADRAYQRVDEFADPVQRDIERFSQKGDDGIRRSQ